MSCPVSIPLRLLCQQDLQPPKELLITVRCLVDLGELVTETGTLLLAKGSQHYVRRSDVEALIRQGHLEHIVD